MFKNKRKSEFVSLNAASAAKLVASYRMAQIASGQEQPVGPAAFVTYTKAIAGQTVGRGVYHSLLVELDRIISYDATRRAVAENDAAWGRVYAI